MIDRGPPKAAGPRGTSLRTRFCATEGAGSRPQSLASHAGRRMVSLQEPASGESRLIDVVEIDDQLVQGALVVLDLAGDLPALLDRRASVLGRFTVMPKSRWQRSAA